MSDPSLGWLAVRVDELERLVQRFATDHVAGVSRRRMATRLFDGDSRQMVAMLDESRRVAEREHAMKEAVQPEQQKIHVHFDDENALWRASIEDTAFDCTSTRPEAAVRQLMRRIEAEASTAGRDTGTDDEPVAEDVNAYPWKHWDLVASILDLERITTRYEIIDGLGVFYKLFEHGTPADRAYLHAVIEQVHLRLAAPDRASTLTPADEAGPADGQSRTVASTDVDTTLVEAEPPGSAERAPRTLGAGQQKDSDPGE